VRTDAWQQTQKTEESSGDTAIDRWCAYLSDEGGGAAELGDGAGDVGGRTAGRLDKAAGLGERDAGHVRHKVDQHLAEGDYEAWGGSGRGGNSVTERRHWKLGLNTRNGNANATEGFDRSIELERKAAGGGWVWSRGAGWLIKG
jgi:hypothetical protein